MLGHKVPDEVFEYLKREKRVIVRQEKGKIVLSEPQDLYNAVAIFLKKSDEDVFSISEEERNEMNKKNILFVTVGDSKDISEVFIPNRYFEDHKYEGRPFLHGLFDCYTLVKDYYRKTFNIFLPTNIQRTWEWWLQGENLYLDNARNYGFVESKDIQIHDVLIMKLNSDVPNHAAIYIGNNKILHHVCGRFSTTEEMTSFYKHNTAVIYRNTKINAN